MKISALQQLESIAAMGQQSPIRIHICLSPEEEQRQFYISIISRIFSWKRILSHPLSESDFFILQLPLLFNSQEILHLEFVENISRKAKNELYTFIQKYPSPLVLSGASYGHCTDLYAKFTESSIIIDLTRETKWGKKNRFKEYCNYEIGRFGKSMDLDAIEYILQKKGENIIELHNEIQKVICQAGSSKTIQKLDVASIISADMHDNWKIRESIAFGVLSKSNTPYVPKDFFQFLQQIRYLIDLAFFFINARDNPAGMEILQKRFPHIKGNLLTHYTMILRDLSWPYCIKAKQALFESEFTAKSSSIPMSVLTSYLIGKLQSLRENTNR